MERNRGTIVAIVAGLIIAVVSLGVAFAAFSTSLTINGNATIASSAWDIHFSTTSGGDEPASAGTTITPTIRSGTATTVSSLLKKDSFSWSGTFKSPGDTLEYRFYVVNGGDYNATISGTFVSTPTCKIGGVTQTTCPITYTVTKDGSTAFSGSDSLAKGASQLVVVKAKLADNYGGDGSGLSSSNIDVTTSTITFTYTQNGSAVSN